MSCDFTASSAFNRLETSYNAALTDFTALIFTRDGEVSASIDYYRCIDKKFDTGFFIGHNGGNGTPQAESYGGGALEASPPFGHWLSGSAYGTWLFLGMRRSGTSKTVYVNSSTTTQTVSGAATDTTTIKLGNAAAINNADECWVGQMCRFALWDVALTDDEVTSFRKGFSPTKIRPQSLKVYYPMIRSTNSAWQNNTTTVVNVGTSDFMPSLIGGVL